MQFGDPLRDLPWERDILAPTELTSSVVTMYPRGAVTGLVTGAAGQALPGQSVCAAPFEGTGITFGTRPDKAWCTQTDADGWYFLHVGSAAAWIFLPGDPTSQGFVKRMDTFLATDDVGPLKEWDVGWPGPAPGLLKSEGPYRDMSAHPGRPLDLALTDLVTGASIQLSGRVPPLPNVNFAGREVCAYSRAGFACTNTDDSGRYELSLPTKVPPDDPTGPVAVKIVLHLWTERFTATPGTSLTRDIELPPDY